MYGHRVIITSSGLMLCPDYEYRTYHRDLPDPKEIAKAKNKQYTKDQQKLRSQFQSRSKFGR